MNWVDVLVAVSIVWSGLRGAWRGFWAQFLDASGLVLGVLAGFWTYAILASLHGRGSAPTPHALRFLGALVAGLLVCFVFHVVSQRSQSWVQSSILGPLNRALGLAAGLVVGALASSLVLLALTLVPLPRSARHAIDTSWSAPRLFALGEEAARSLGPHVPGARGLAAAYARAAHPATPERR